MAKQRTVVGGLGAASDEDVLEGVSYTSDNGIKRKGLAKKITIDETLTEYGQAADAGVVGAMFNECEKKLPYLDSVCEYQLGGYGGMYVLYKFILNDVNHNGGTPIGTYVTNPDLKNRIVNFALYNNNNEKIWFGKNTNTKLKEVAVTSNFYDGSSKNYIFLKCVDIDGNPLNIKLTMNGIELSSPILQIDTLYNESFTPTKPYHPVNKKYVDSIFDTKNFGAENAGTILGIGADGTIVYKPEISFYIVNALTDVETSNIATSIEQGQPYNSILSVIDGELENVTVIIGGVDLTSTFYAQSEDNLSGIINIPQVNGNILITANNKIE